MKRTLIGLLLLIFSASCRGLDSDALAKQVRLQISPAVRKGAVLHWRIVNDGRLAVYVYNVFLWGPALTVQRTPSEAVIDTTPVREDPGCPPNRFPPVLLLAIGPGRSLEGDLIDSRITGLKGLVTSMRIVVGSDPYSVVDAAKRYMSSNCKHSPYDAIVEWGTIIKSNPIRVP